MVVGEVGLWICVVHVNVYLAVKFNEILKDRFIKFSCLITVDEVELIIEDNGLDLDFSYLEGKFTSKIEGVFFYNWRELKLAVENLKGTLLVERAVDMRKTTLTLPLKHEQKIYKSSW